MCKGKARNGKPLCRMISMVLATQIALLASADIEFGTKWYEALADHEGVACCGWHDFYMGANVAIPVTVTDEHGQSVELTSSHITIKPGTYIDYGTPYVLTEREMWETYGSPIFQERNSRGRIKLEKDGGIWVYNNWDWEDSMGITYELEKGIWPFFDIQNSNDDDVSDWLSGHADRQWILIPTGTRPQKGTHTFTMQLSVGGNTATYPVSFKMASDQKAKAATVRFNANGGTVGEYGRVVNLNKAIGELPVPEERLGYKFGGWFTDKKKGVKISASTKVTKSMMVYARWTPKKYKVSAAVNSKTMGSVSGAGTKAYNSKVTLKATPKKGCVFVRWEQTGSEDTPWPSVAKCRQSSVSFTLGAADVSVRAVFAKASADAAPVLTVTSADEWNVEVEPGREIRVEVDSLSYPAVTVKGAPAGIGLVRVADMDDATYVLKVTDASKMKPGVYTAKITAKNRAGKSVSKSIRIVAPNSTAAIAAGLISGLKTSTLDPYEPVGGMKTEWTLADLGAEVFATNGWKLASVTGLPAGLKWNGSAIVGAASKTGVFTVTFTMKKTVKTGKKTKTYTSTASATFKVEALLPAELAGTYNGFANTNFFDPGDEGDNGDEGDGGEVENVVYTPLMDKWASAVKVTVTTAGKITANIGGVALSGNGFDSVSNGVYAVTLKKTQKISKGALKGKSKVWEAYIEIDTNADWSATQLAGWCQTYTTGLPGMAAPSWITCQRNAFGGNADAKAVAAAVESTRKFNAKSVKGVDWSYDLVAGTALTVKAKANGVVTLAGKIGSLKVSGSATLEVSAVEMVEVEPAVQSSMVVPRTLVLRCSSECDDPVLVARRTATARFFVGKFIVEVFYTLEDGSVVSVSGRVWKK